MGRIDQLLAVIPREHKTHGHPFVTLSYAQSLDGSISARRDEPLRISGPESLRMTHQLRAAHDAILVGVGTILADDPNLTVRLVKGENPQAVILDSRLRTPLDANLLQNAGKNGIPRPWIATTDRANPDKASLLERAGVRLLVVPANLEGKVDISGLLAKLAEQGVNSVMVEGGAGVISSFLRARTVDLVVITIAPVFIGGVRAFEMPHLSQAEPPQISRETTLSPDDFSGKFPSLRDPQYLRLGTDLVVWGELAHG